VNSQPETPQVRDNKLGSGDRFPRLRKMEAVSST
jgi:hypothetical protein